MSFAGGALSISLAWYIWQRSGGALSANVKGLITAVARAIVEQPKKEEETSASSNGSIDASKRDYNKIPLRPVHYVLRPHADPRVDKSLYVKYDPHPDCKTGAIMIVVPGGNYDESDIYGHEAQTVAQWLLRLGITAVVLQYRCISQGHYWPAQFEDWSDCARAVKAQAEGWFCDPSRIGVIGFSAGGHLAAYAALKASIDIRPRVQVPFFLHSDVICISITFLFIIGCMCMTWEFLMMGYGALVHRIAANIITTLPSSIVILVVVLVVVFVFVLLLCLHLGLGCGLGLGLYFHECHPPWSSSWRWP